jgi:hypothetical protein
VSELGGASERMALAELNAQELDSLGRATGVEAEALADLSEPDTAFPDTVDEGIREPFDPDKIDVVTRTSVVELLLSRIKNGRIDLQPEFQRHRGIWTPRAKSRLIESLLLRIPLPTLYAAEDEHENWAIVDGIQRLTAIAEFIAPESVGSSPLILRDLEYLTHYDGARFHNLPGRLQTRLREAELVVHLIRLGTPEPVKFNIFARINTGGTPLSAQELRHALIGGPARDRLRAWAEMPEFLTVTLGSIKSERMADREMVLRFVAFQLLGPEAYLSDDFDEFLRRAMRKLNDLRSDEVEALGEDFRRALTTSHGIFGSYAFRKRTLGDLGRRNPINKALFEVVTVTLARLAQPDLHRVLDAAESVKEGFLELMDDYTFLASISVGTGQISHVRYRFRTFQKMIEGALR